MNLKMDFMANLTIAITEEPNIPLQHPPTYRELN
jgi:hypothetical protein